MAQVLDVYICNALAGHLTRNEHDQMAFAYETSYNGPNLSVAFPNNGHNSFVGRQVSTWFDNLLPDDQSVRDGMASNLGYKGTNTFRLLSDYGLDLPGAVQVVSAGNDPIEPDPRYVKISIPEIGNRLRSMLETSKLGAKRTWMRGHERWSLAGGQPKLALHRIDNEFYQIAP